MMSIPFLSPPTELYAGVQCNIVHWATHLAGGGVVLYRYQGNERRLTGAHETAPIDKFSFGVAHRGASIRIPRAAEANGKGYFEDRRPASNMDPYVVTSLVFETSCLEPVTTTAAVDATA